MDTLVFLGTGDAMGVPRVYCNCENCMEARTGGMNARLRSSVLIDNGSDFLRLTAGRTGGGRWSCRGCAACAGC